MRGRPPGLALFSDMWKRCYILIGSNERGANRQMTFGRYGKIRGMQIISRSGREWLVGGWLKEASASLNVFLAFALYYLSALQDLVHEKTE